MWSKSLVLFSAFFAGVFLFSASPAHAASATADVHLVDDSGVGKSIGTVTFTDTDNGLQIKTDLEGLPEGPRGFHIHENGSCAPSEKDGKMTAANAAGGHYDPQKTKKHMGPAGMGHKGDLPALQVGRDGKASATMNVQGLTADEVRGRAVMVHKGGDNYSDMPVELGGGGARIACGVIQ